MRLCGFGLVLAPRVAGYRERMAERLELERHGGLLLVIIVFGVLVCAAIVGGGLLVISAVAFSDTDEDDVRHKSSRTSPEFV